jgi:hypothetical protein
MTRRHLDRLPVRHYRSGICPKPSRVPIVNCDAGEIDDTAVDLFPCNDKHCAACTAMRLRGKYRTRKRKIRWEIDAAEQNCFMTVTLHYEHQRLFLTDHREHRQQYRQILGGDQFRDVLPARYRDVDQLHLLEHRRELTERYDKRYGADPPISELDDMTIARMAKVNQMKRLRRNGCPAFLQATVWELHEGEHAASGGDGSNRGKPHAHVLMHARDKRRRVVRMRLAAGSYVWPSGYRPPKRRIKIHKISGEQYVEGEHDYFRRLIFGEVPLRFRDEHWARIASGEIPWTPAEGLAAGHRRWLALSGVPGPEAREARLKLPFQMGNFNCSQIRHGKAAAKYALKVAQYTMKGAGRWSTSPYYGRPKPPKRDGARTVGADGPLPAEHLTQSPRPASGVDTVNFCQEERALARLTEPPQPPATGPPVTEPALAFDRWASPSEPNNGVSITAHIRAVLGPPCLPEFRLVAIPPNPSFWDERIFALTSLRTKKAASRSNHRR